MSTLYVTNQSDNLLEFDYEFKTIQFPKGKTVEITEKAARHIFGYLDSNKEEYMVRLGFIQTKNDIEKGLKRLEKFVISNKPPKQNHSLSPVVDESPSHENKVLPLNREKGKIQVAG
jgi:hypothetical protein